jgi:4-amino-4-deoxy-L-arabinose transferase-like glycosyltransferase
MSEARARERWAAPIVLLGAASMFALHMGGRIYESRDVPRYAQMVLEMQHHGTLVPTLNGRPYHGAAPLAAWAPYFLSWLTGALGPVEVRLFPALAAFASVLATWLVARRASARTGAIAAAACAASYLATYYARGSRIETILELGVAVAILAFFAAGELRGGRRLAAFALSGLGLALGIAAKGPFAVALVGAALGPFLLYERRWRDAIQGGLVVAAVSAALTAGWLLPYVDYLGHRQAAKFFHDFLGRETVAKFEGHMGKVEPFWAYAVGILHRLAPWSFVAIAGLVRVLRRPSVAAPLERLAACWVVFPLLLLSAAAGKNMRYVVPLIPGFAILSGYELDRWLRSTHPVAQRALRVGVLVLGGVLAITGLGALIVFPSLFGASGYAFVTALAVVGGAGAALVAARRHELPRALLALYVSLAGAVSFDYAAILPLPQVAEHSEYVRLSRELAPHLREGETLASVAPTNGEVRRFEPSALALYLGGRWVDECPREKLPDESPVLAQRPIEGRAVRAEIDWVRHRGQPPERWLLLEPLGSRGEAAPRVGRGD